MSALHIGCHLSPSKGLLTMAESASAIGADTFRFFARNPRGSRAKYAEEIALVRRLADDV